jgi:multiple sugar transport system ATP-binding protein
MNRFNLDASLREKMRTELKTLFKKLKATIIYVTHDQQEAMGLSDKIAIIDKGRLKQIGLSDELYSHPKNLFVASFLGSPKINTFEVMVEDDNFILGSVRLRIPQEYGVRIKNLNRIFLGIRAEDVRVYPDKKPNTFAVSVIMIEKMGKYSILTLDLQGQTFKSIIDNEFTCKLDNNVWVEFNERRLYLFNTDTQEAV